MMRQAWKRSILMSVLSVTLTIGLAQTVEDLNDPPPGEWPQFGRDAAATRYSPLDQINVGNVENLVMTWARDLGFSQTHQGTPVAWDGVVYVSHQTGVLALDGTTGEELWSYSSPADEDLPISDSAVRGGPVVYDGKVFINLRHGMTVALDKDTGEELWATQLTEAELNEGATTNPIFADGKLIIGPTGADFGGAPGKIVAVDAEVGELLWSFDVVPMSPDDPAFDTWTNPPSWEDGIGGGAAWNAGAYDPVTRTVVYGTGQPTPWDRVDWRRNNDGEPSSDLYTSSFVALDIDTGDLKWHHQVVPGDEWDHDQHTVPMFGTVEIDGQDRRVALLSTTTGYLVVVDAESGEFLHGHQIADRVTIHVGYDENGMAQINPDARFEEEGTLTEMCPGLRWAHIAPGAFSPDTGLVYRPNNDVCWNIGALTLPGDWEPGERAWWSDSQPRTDEQWDVDRLGAITAIDPTTGDVVWEFGTQYGADAGPVVTAGDLVFVNSTDRRLRALNATTGEVAWEQVLTAGSRSGTITYSVDGKQYVATMVGMANAGTGSIADYNPNAGVPEPTTGNVAVFVFSLP